MQVRLLGPVELWHGDVRSDLGTPRRRCVLAVLAMTPGQPVAPETLLDRVWGEQSPPHARDALYSHVSRLRAPIEGHGGALTRRDGGYVLEIDPGQVDLHLARRLAAQASAATDPAEAATLLAEATQLWRGPPLAGLPGDWAARVRTALDQERLALLTERFEVELRLGRHATVLGPLSAAQAEHPLAESLAGLLMLALYRTGRQTEALAVYAQIRHRLVAEIGDEPGQPLRELHARVLRRDPELAQPAAVAGGPAPPPPVAVVPAQLPPDVAAFTGRASQLQRLDALLPDRTGPDPVTIAVIEGTAGVGKTALALRWAHRYRHRFPDGQLYVDLRGYAAGAPLAPIQALTRFLHALDVPPEQVSTDLDEATAMFRSRLADRRMLVVLDNAAGADQVRPLLPGGGGSVVLVTSRDQLGGLVARDGAHRLPLDVLAPDESVALLAGLLAADPDRDDAEPVALAELAQLCGHLPLALRVAAAHLIGHPHHRLADYLRLLHGADRLGALAVTGDESNAVPAAFDLSYARLPDPAQRLFRLLGLVPGPDLTAEAAAALAAVPLPQARQLLEVLAGAHLVEEHATGRYSAHDLLRGYAAARAEAEEAGPARAAALDRLYEHYLQTTDAAVRLINPVFVRLPVPASASTGASPGASPGAGRFEDAAAATGWLDAERANLVAAVTRTAQCGPRSVAWHLADVLRGYLVLGPPGYDWATVATAGLAAATAEGDPRGQASGHLSHAYRYFRRSQYGESIDHAAAALRHARQADWAEGQGASLNILGSSYWPLGELDAALDHFTQAAAVFERAGWREAVAALHGNLGRVTVEMGRLADAAGHAERGLAATRALGIPLGEAISLEILGEISHGRGQLEAALDFFARSLELSRSLGYHSGAGDALHGLATVHRDRSDRPRAVEHAVAALALAREHSLRRLELNCLCLLAELAADPVGGYQRALALARETDNRHPEAEALLGLATAHRREGRYPEARCHAGQALTIARKFGYQLLVGNALGILTEIHLAEGAVEQAVEAGEAALAIYQQAGHRLGEARARQLLERAAAAPAPDGTSPAAAPAPDGASPAAAPAPGGASPASRRASDACGAPRSPAE